MRDRRHQPRQLALLLCALWLAALTGCTETVGVFSLELGAPAWEPPLTCKDDPRRMRELSMRFECPDETVVMKRSLDGNFNISDVPLGECTIKVEALNSHGRVVAAGQVIAEIVRGDNPAIKVPLIPASCGVDCDGDGDGLASTDEVALGLKSDVKDSDGDGLDDGLELTQCCSDPKNRDDGDRCQLLINAVIPPLGPAGESVIIKATKRLDKPSVQLGDAPLDSPLVDATTVFGRVGAKAVLGEVRVTSGGSTEVAAGLFAVLERDPEPVFEIDQRAGTKAGLMQRLVDMAQGDGGTFLLGQAAGSTSSAGGNTGGGVLLKLDRRRQQVQRVALASKGRPVALSVQGDRVAVLTQEGTRHALLTYTVSTFPTSARAAVRMDTGPRRAVGFVVLPTGVVVLFHDAVGLYGNDGSGKTIPLGEVTRTLLASRQTAGAPVLAPLVRGCTGMTYHGASDQLYLSCNAASATCKPGQPCAQIAALVRIGPLKTCAASLGTPNSAAGCGALFINTGARAIGAPVVDAARRRIYALTSAGVAEAPAGAGGGIKPALLRLVAPFSPNDTGRGPRRIAVDGKGHVYVANGPTVVRIDKPDPNGKTRGGRAMRIGIAGEQALMLTVARGDGALDIGRHQVADSLLTVCLARCATCACR